MANGNGKAASTRHRFSVPEKDDTVLRWIENQSNLSISLRMVIRWAIQEYGFQDVTCLGVQRRRGRPNGTAEDMNYERGSSDTVAQSAPVVQKPMASVIGMPMQSGNTVVQPEVEGEAPKPKSIEVKDKPKRNIPGLDDMFV